MYNDSYPAFESKACRSHMHKHHANHNGHARNTRRIAESVISYLLAITGKKLLAQGLERKPQIISEMGPGNHTPSLPGDLLNGYDSIYENV